MSVAKGTYKHTDGAFWAITNGLGKGLVDSNQVPQGYAPGECTWTYDYDNHLTVRWNFGFAGEENERAVVEKGERVFDMDDDGKVPEFLGEGWTFTAV